MKIKPGSLIVFEGLDKTGKSTQAMRLLEATDDVAALHMPSGAATLSNELYELMEDTDANIDPLARQLLHLACHAQNMDYIHEEWERRGLILDRWWWSTVAYGYYGAELDVRIPPQVFMNVVGMVWSGVRADVVFVSTEPYAEDRLNNERVAEGYKQLFQQAGSTAVQLPVGSEDEIHEFVANKLEELELCTR